MIKYKLKDLIFKNNTVGYCWNAVPAFIGRTKDKLISKSKNLLYLITYDRIISASNFIDTYSDEEQIFEVKKFIFIKISEV